MNSTGENSCGTSHWEAKELSSVTQCRSAMHAAGFFTDGFCGWMSG